MTKDTGRKLHSRAKLQDTDEMAQRFHQFGLEGMPHWMIAQELGCHRNTVGYFLRRAPKCDAAHKRGLGEAEAEGRMTHGRGWEAQRAWRAARKPAEPKPGEICPTCRQTVREGEQSVTLTASQLAEAQRTLDALLDRHLAARNVDGEEGGAA